MIPNCFYSGVYFSHKFFKFLHMNLTSLQSNFTCSWFRVLNEGGSAIKQAMKTSKGKEDYFSKHQRFNKKWALYLLYVSFFF